MLIYELYKTKIGSNQVSGNGVPLKKIFVKNGTVTIDKTTSSEFDTDDVLDKMHNFFQEKFGMPLDTTVTDLPKKIVPGNNAAKPYVTISGDVQNFKKKDIASGQITLGNKKKGAYASLSIPDLKRQIVSADTIFKENKENYLIDNDSLYQKYHTDKILINKKLSSELFEKIASEFFDFISERNVDFITGKTNFVLYVLPEGQITHEEKQDVSDISFIDSFGNKSNEYPDKPMTDAAFCSYDDKAFPINCKVKQDFYKNFNLGNKSHANILLPEKRVRKIAKFDWYFINLDDPKKYFKKESQGLFFQLYSCYNMLKKSEIKKEQLKVLCIKKTQAKKEIIINENLSMPKLDRIFKDVSKIPFNVLESLVIKKGKNPITRYYFVAIKSILNGTKFDYNLLIKIYTDQIHDQIKEWLDAKNQTFPQEFFDRSEFCKKVLKPRDNNDNVLSEEEEYATGVGVMARNYIEFRQKENLVNNSFKTILQKPRYTVKDLQNVISEIGRSINLLKLEDTQYNDIVSKLSDTIPKSVDENTNKDFSYYFYYGYFKRDTK